MVIMVYCHPEETIMFEANPRSSELSWQGLNFLTEYLIDEKWEKSYALDDKRL